jgi:predicted NUDIX family phosphoesterase
VLVAPTELFRGIGYFQGFCHEPQRYLDTLLSPQHTSYRPRHEVEEDPSYKQLIPYVIFRHRDSSGQTSVFQYTRGKGQGEGRLHSKRSVGIGGHISVDDDRPVGRDTYNQGMRRELEEEVFIDAQHTLACVGLINDDETPVGQVHLGVVHLCDVSQPRVRPREAAIHAAGFKPVESLLADLEGFETWSQICLRALFA